VVNTAQASNREHREVELSDLLITFRYIAPTAPARSASTPKAWLMGWLNSIVTPDRWSSKPQLVWVQVSGTCTVNLSGTPVFPAKRGKLDRGRRSF